jgi:hypothetical protein
MRVAREEILRGTVDIGEVAAPAARDQDLLSRLVGMVEQQYPAPTRTRRQSAHQASGTGTDNDCVEIRRTASSHGHLHPWPSSEPLP